MNERHTPEEAQEVLEGLVDSLLADSEALRSISEWLAQFRSVDPRVPAAVSELRAASIDVQTARTRLGAFAGPRAKARLDGLDFA